MYTTKIDPQVLFCDIVTAYRSATGEDPAAMSNQKTYSKAIAILVTQAFEQQGQIWKEVQQLPRLIKNHQKNDKVKSRVHWLLDRQISKVYIQSLNEKIKTATTEAEKKEWGTLLSIWSTVDQQRQNYYSKTGGVVAFGGQLDIFLPAWFEK